MSTSRPNVPVPAQEQTAICLIQHPGRSLLLRLLPLILLGCSALFAACEGDGSPAGPETTTGTIGGTVTDASSGSALSGASVTTQPATSTVATDAQGAYTIPNVPSGSYTVSAALTGYDASTTAVVVNPRQTSTANLALAPLPGTITGTVTDASSGSVLAGATVTTQPATSTELSDAQGIYTIANVPAGSYSVSATLAGYEASTASVVVNRGQASTANIALPPLPSTLRAGNWTGVYGSGTYGLSFVADAEGKIRDFTITDRVNAGACGTITAEIDLAGPVTVAEDGSFALTAARSGITVTLSGAFSSSTEASGTWKESFFVIGGGFLCFGSSSNILWNARKDCTVKPTQGVSATRFCS